MSGQKNIFITGVTGFLGGYIAWNILENTPHQLYCLSRSKRRQSAEDRLWSRLEELDASLLSKFKHRIHAVEGDITAPDLGITAALPAAMDEVWHCAAVLDFEHHKEEETIDTNFRGLQNVLRYMRKCRIPVLTFVSTAYVAGRANGNIPAAYYEHTAETNNPYEESKRLCEAEIINEHQDFGLQYRIFRPSIIIGNSKTLAAESSSGLYGYLSILLRLKDSIELKMPDYFKFNPLKIWMKKGANLNLICVDHVAESMVSICENDQTLNDVFHISNPSPNPIDQTITLMGEAFGIQTVPVYDREVLGPIDYLLSAEEEIFNSYLMAEQFFECEKTYRLSNMDPQSIHIRPEEELQVMRAMKDKFENDKRVQRARLKSVTHKLAAKSLSLPDLESLTYYEGGKGPAIIILNAYGQSLSFWDKIVDKLFRKYKVIIWSMRGTSSQVGGVEQVYSLEVHRDDIKAIFDQEKLESCRLLAWCTGPKIALEFQHSHPDLVQSMIFLSGCYKGIPAFKHLHTSYENDMQEICGRVDKSPEITAFVIDTLKSILAGGEEERSYEELVDTDKRNLIHEILGLISKDVKSMVIEPFLSIQSALNYGRQLLLFWKKNPQELIKQLQVPVLLVSGTEDKIASNKMSEAVAELSAFTSCATIQGGSHYLHYDQVDLLVEIIDKFVKEGTDFHFKHGLVRVKNKTLVPSNEQQ